MRTVMKVFFCISRGPALLLGVIFLSLMTAMTTIQAAEPRVRVLVSTYPLYLFTRNVVQSRSDVQVDLLIPAQTGCPHDYALTPGDMRKLAKAHILIINGLGLEDFMEKPLHDFSRGLRVIDGSVDITPLARSEEGQGHAPQKDRGHGSHGHGDGHAHGHSHGHGGVNPHAFSSPRQAAAMVRTVARELARADPQGAQDYTTAGEIYAVRLDRLGEQLAAVGAGASNKKVVLLHEGMAYFIRDAGLHLMAVIQESEDSQPSAARLLELTREIRQNKPAAIVGEPQYSNKPVLALAAETGVPALQLDPVASGPADAPPDYYERTMTANRQSLEKYFGK